MDTSDSERNGPTRSRRFRDLGFWIFGVLTAILVNLLSNDTASALRVVAAGAAIVVVLFAVDLIRRTPPSSSLRHYARPVMLTLVAPLILMSALGVGGGYLVFLAAALVAVGVSNERDIRTAVVTLLGMALIAAGAAGLHLLAEAVTVPVGQRGGWSVRPLLAAGAGPESGGQWGTGIWWLVVARSAVGALLAVAGGAALLARGDRLLSRLMTTMLALRFLVIGTLVLVMVIASLGAVRSSQDAAEALISFGFAVAVLGYGLLSLLPPDRIDRIRRGWRKLTQERSPDEPHLPYRELVRQMLRATSDFLDRQRAVER
ncbi:hypothetical protein [Krasilnikovia sp. M28-CT-15]|uniref:hypothetical protein n=1 Tax=Krasilnikovia sp. M28-CT-15 TaxID=3373540 RepID=UPI00399D52B4